jgi:hypothetical protein
MVVSKCPKLAETITEIDSSYLHTVPKEGVLWPTPSAIDSADYPLRKVARESLKKGGWRGINLNQAVKIYPTPTASEGEKYRLQGNTQGSKCLMALHGGKLNPQFVEWLMGWPIGWTDLEHVETESFLIKHIEHIQNLSKEQSKGGI